MPKGYWIAHVHVTDPETYKLYVAGAAAPFAEHKAKFLARGGTCSELEGGQGRERNVVIEFPSYQAALDCYNSPGYQAAKQHRDKSGVASLTIVEGA